MKLVSALISTKHCRLYQRALRRSQTSTSGLTRKSLVLLIECGALYCIVWVRASRYMLKFDGPYKKVDRFYHLFRLSRLRPVRSRGFIRSRPGRRATIRMSRLMLVTSLLTPLRAVIRVLSLCSSACGKLAINTISDHWRHLG